MTNEQFERDYPRDKYRYERTSYRTKGPMQETEIETFNIICIETGETVLQPTRTEHFQQRGLINTIKWDW